MEQPDVLRIFISYRRDESVAYARSLYRDLGKHFPEGQVFWDISQIDPGVDFVDAIERAVGSCDALIAVIGRDWLNIADHDGQRRLDSPADFVRLEIATALERNVRVVPVLVQGASMPAGELLPEALRKLARRNAFELSDSRWDYDVEQLVSALKRVPTHPLVPPTGRVPVDELLAGPRPPAVSRSSNGRSAPKPADQSRKQIPLSRRSRVLIAGVTILVLALGGLLLATAGGGLAPLIAASPPTVASTRIAPTPQELSLFQDLLDNPATGQLLMTSPDPTMYVVGYVDGEYMVRLIDPARNRAPIVFVPGSYADATLAVEARLVGDTAGRWVDLSCRYQLQSQTSGVYIFRTEIDSASAVLYRYGSDGLVQLAAASASASLRPAPDATNRLALSCKGHDLVATINDQPVLKAQDDRYTNGGLGIGVGSQPTANTPSDVRFRNLGVTR